eukprot:Skav200699  [mRNA]  locus=scaffold4825:31428:33809:+ [translate_table: standard]
MAGTTDDPARHPIVVAMRALLRALHGQHRPMATKALQSAAIVAHEATMNGSLGRYLSKEESRRETRGCCAHLQSHSEALAEKLQPG